MGRTCRAHNGEVCKQFFKEDIREINFYEGIEWGIISKRMLNKYDRMLWI
jgi:hypothetical protein